MQSEAENLIEEVALELAASFKARIVDLSGKPFTESGVTCPDLEVWRRYARAVTALIVDRCAQRARECFDDPQAETEPDYVPSGIRSLIPAQPEAKEAHAEAWPNGCHSPNSCTRHMACMYTNCRHENLPIKAEIEAALKAKEAREDE